MKNHYAESFCRYILLAGLFFISFLTPGSAYAQLDEKHPDANDGLDIPFEITAIRNGEFASDTV